MLTLINEIPQILVWSVLGLFVAGSGTGLVFLLLKGKNPSNACGATSGHATVDAALRRSQQLQLQQQLMFKRYDKSQPQPSAETDSIFAGPNLQPVLQPQSLLQMQSRMPSNAAQTVRMLFCTKCGVRNLKSSSFCSACGAPIKKMTPDILLRKDGG